MAFFAIPAVPVIVQWLVGGAVVGGVAHQTLPGKAEREQSLANAFGSSSSPPNDAMMMQGAQDGAGDDATPAAGTGANTTDCVGQCPPEKKADDPGQPKPNDGYEPPKKWDGQKVRNPNGPGKGWPDRNGDVWVPTGHGPTAHGGPHWDVQTPGGGYRNVYPGGRVR